MKTEWEEKRKIGKKNKEEERDPREEKDEEMEEMKEGTCTISKRKRERMRMLRKRVCWMRDWRLQRHCSRSGVSWKSLPMCTLREIECSLSLSLSLSLSPFSLHLNFFTLHDAGETKNMIDLLFSSDLNSWLFPGMTRERMRKWERERERERECVYERERLNEREREFFFFNFKMLHLCGRI